MPKTPKKPAVPPYPATTAKPGGKGPLNDAKANARLQTGLRWQRTKRYGWDSR